MAQLRQDHSKFVEKDTVVVAVGPEDTDTFAKYWAENDMPFPGIPDPDHTIADLYEQKVSIIKLGRMPAQVIIDKQGIVRYIHYGNSMKDIPHNKEVLKILDELS
ncbi:redoxin domain-containing protein [Alkalibacter sp. M17DMB]|nr:redoxin domain-containing protein [Alkalibacter mobilis]